MRYKSPKFAVHFAISHSEKGRLTKVNHMIFNHLKTVNTHNSFPIAFETMPTILNQKINIQQLWGWEKWLKHLGIEISQNQAIRIVSPLNLNHRKISRTQSSHIYGQDRHWLLNKGQPFIQLNNVPSKHIRLIQNIVRQSINT